MHQTFAFLQDIGGGEMVIVGIVALLLFGKNLPTQARNIGKAIGEFKKTLNDAKGEITKEMDNAAREVEKAAEDAKLKETVADLHKSIKDEPASKLDMPTHNPPAAAPVPAPEKPMGLDSPSASSVATSSLEKPRAAVAVSHAAALDNLERNIPAPKKIPPPI